MEEIFLHIDMEHRARRLRGPRTSPPTSTAASPSTPSCRSPPTCPARWRCAERPDAAGEPRRPRPRRGRVRRRRAGRVAGAAHRSGPGRRGAPVPRRRLEPDLPGAPPRPSRRPGAAAPAERGKAAGAHDMGREHDIQAALAPVFPYVARMVGSCARRVRARLGVLRHGAADGTILRQRPARMGARPAAVVLALRARAGRARRPALRRRHTVPALAGLGRGAGYVARQVSRLDLRLERARTDDTGDWSDLAGWIDAHQPADVAQVLIHNDFRFDNLVLAAAPATAADRRRARLGDGHGGRPADGPRRHAGLLGAGRRRRVLPDVPPPAHHAPGMWTRERVGASATARAWARDAPSSAGASTRCSGCSGSRSSPSRSGTATCHRQTTNEAYAVLRARRSPTSSSAAAASRSAAPDGRRAAGAPRAGLLRRRRLRRALADRLGAGPLLGPGWPAQGRDPDVVCAARCAGTARAARRSSTAPAGACPDVARSRIDPAGTSSTTSASSAPSPTPPAGERCDRRPARSSGSSSGPPRAGPRGSTTRTTPRPTRASRARPRRARRDATARAGSGTASSWSPPAVSWRPLRGAGAGRGRRRLDVRRCVARFNTVCVNSSVTRVVVARSGARLLTFNEHEHLAPDQLTYR